VITKGNDLSGAIFSDCERYRYRLWRRWGEGRAILWLMLNPSTATADVDDPTIRRCTDWSRRWGYGRIDVCNLFAWRSTDPHALKWVGDPVGPDNLAHIKEASAGAAEVICAWGCNVPTAHQIWPDRVCETLDRVLRCLGRNIDGSPKHPLYVPRVTAPVWFRNIWSPDRPT